MGCHDHQGAEEILQACFALHLDMGEEERKKTHNWVCSPKIHNLVSTSFGLLSLLIHPQPSCLPPLMRLLAYLIFFFFSLLLPVQIINYSTRTSHAPLVKPKLVSWYKPIVGWVFESNSKYPPGINLGI
jgi:hypothetical protein